MRAPRDQAAQVLEQSPYSGLLGYLPDGKHQWYAFVTLLVTILTLIVQTAEMPRNCQRSLFKWMRRR